MGKGFDSNSNQAKNQLREIIVTLQSRKFKLSCFNQGNLNSLQLSAHSARKNKNIRGVFNDPWQLTIFTKIAPS